MYAYGNTETLENLSIEHWKGNSSYGSSFLIYKIFGQVFIHMM